jgi:hypothetical protein
MLALTEEEEEKLAEDVESIIAKIQKGRQITTAVKLAREELKEKACRKYLNWVTLEREREFKIWYQDVDQLMELMNRHIAVCATEKCVQETGNCWITHCWIGWFEWGNAAPRDEEGKSHIGEFVESTIKKKVDTEFEWTPWQVGRNHDLLSQLMDEKA